MQDTLRGIISDLHVFLYGGIRSLPFTLGGTMLVLGLFTSNYAILFFLIGLLVLAPAGSWIMNRLLPIIWNAGHYIVYYSSFLFTKDGIKEPASWIKIPYFETQVFDVCKMVIPYMTKDNGEKEVIISSEWMAMVAFFMGYMISNALQLYLADTTSSASLNMPNKPETEVKVNKRKAQAIISLVSIILFTIVAISFRMYTGCERWEGILFTAIGFGTAGYYWYDLLSQVGQGRLSDIFGIANRLLAPSAIQNGPIACVPIPA